MRRAPVLVTSIRSYWFMLQYYISQNVNYLFISEIVMIHHVSRKRPTFNDLRWCNFHVHSIELMSTVAA